MWYNEEIVIVSFEAADVTYGTGFLIVNDLQ